MFEGLLAWGTYVVYCCCRLYAIYVLCCIGSRRTVFLRPDQPASSYERQEGPPAPGGASTPGPYAQSTSIHLPGKLERSRERSEDPTLLTDSSSSGTCSTTKLFDPFVVIVIEEAMMFACFCAYLWAGAGRALAGGRGLGGGGATRT